VAEGLAVDEFGRDAKLTRTSNNQLQNVLPSSLSRYQATVVLLLLSLLFDGNSSACASYNCGKGAGACFKDLECHLQASVRHTCFASGDLTSGITQIAKFSLHAYITCGVIGFSPIDGDWDFYELPREVCILLNIYDMIYDRAMVSLVRLGYKLL
jgi:hypothetical protein